MKNSTDWPHFDSKPSPRLTIRVNVAEIDDDAKQRIERRIERRVHFSLDRRWDAVRAMDIRITDIAHAVAKRCRINATLSDGSRFSAESTSRELESVVAVALQHLAQMLSRQKRLRVQRRRFVSLSKAGATP